MTALELEGMCDVSIKPKLLRSLLREYVPDERHPFTNSSELAYIVSTVKTQKLLYDWTPQPAKRDLVEAWKSAVDSWVHRLLTLASSNLPDKCWAGICLLGLTSQECSPDRFVTSYAVWLDKLLSCLQLPDVSNFVKAASCASLSDIFTRLSGFSNAKKDGNSHATKVIQAALKLLIEDNSDVVLEGAICLLCTMTNFFPLSVHRLYDSVETAIVSKMMSENCCASVLKKLAYALSLLPKARGDEDSWSLMMDKIMLHINSQLNDAFQGLEEEATNTQMMKALLPSGKEPPPPLGGLDVSRTSDLSTRRPERMLGSRISILMQCCCDMLTNIYPVMVRVPVFGLVALARRVLAVDSSLSSSSYSFMTTLKQELICSEIPVLQLHGLEILAALVKALSSQLLPYAAGIVLLLVEYLRTCQFLDLKIKAYSILKVLLMAMGIGTAVHISQDIVNSVCIDLEFIECEKDGQTGTSTVVHPELLTESRQRKRKRAFMARPSQEQPVYSHSEVENPRSSIPISLKIAALETLEALLTVGGSMRSERWRENVDRLLISVATSACKGGWSREENIFLTSDSLPTLMDFQLAALRTLLASLLSPGRTRPSHLALALHLFRRGTHEARTKISDYCGHALLALEVLIHPRALPLIDSSSSEYLCGEKVSTYRIGKNAVEPESEDDDLNENWLVHNNEMDIQIAGSLGPQLPNESLSVEDATTMLMAGGNNDTPEPREFENNVSKQGTEVDGGGIVGQIEELGAVGGEVNCNVNEIAENSDAVVSGAIENKGMDENDERTTIVERISSMFASDYEVSDDSFPDIVDGDPDSD